MAKDKPNGNWGGQRAGAGRPPSGRTIAVSVRISQEAKAILDAQENKSQFIDALILHSKTP